MVLSEEYAATLCEGRVLLHRLPPRPIPGAPPPRLQLLPDCFLQLVSHVTEGRRLVA